MNHTSELISTIGTFLYYFPFILGFLGTALVLYNAEFAEWWAWKGAFIGGIVGMLSFIVCTDLFLIQWKETHHMYFQGWGWGAGFGLILFAFIDGYQEARDNATNEQAAYDDFAYAGQRNHEQTFHETQQESGAYGFDSSRFRSKKEADRYQKWQNMATAPSAAPNERMKALKMMIAADNGEIDGIKQLPAPS